MLFVIVLHDGVSVALPSVSSESSSDSRTMLFRSATLFFELSTLTTQKPVVKVK